MMSRPGSSPEESPLSTDGRDESAAEPQHCQRGRGKGGQCWVRGSTGACCGWLAAHSCMEGSLLLWTCRSSRSRPCLCISGRPGQPAQATSGVLLWGSLLAWPRLPENLLFPQGAALRSEPPTQPLAKPSNHLSLPDLETPPLRWQGAGRDRMVSTR